MINPLHSTTPNQKNQNYSGNFSLKGGAEKGYLGIKDLTKIPVIADNFIQYSYSKKSHFNTFRENNYDKIFYGRDITHYNSNIMKYQNLLIFSFITENLPEGSRILQIGNKDNTLFDHFKYRYEIWRIEDAGILKNSFQEIRTQKTEMFSKENVLEKKSMQPNYFDFIFSASAFFRLEENEIDFRMILNNLMEMLLPGGYALNCFLGETQDNIHLKYNRLLNYFDNHINPLNYSVQRFNSVIDTEEILNDKDLYLTEVPGEDRGEKINRLSYNFLWKKNSLELPLKSNTPKDHYIDNYPIYLFHHLMKCGGTSVKEILHNWFNVEYDYFEDHNNLNEFMKYKLNTDLLNGDTCIAGHFQYEGIFIHQRYLRALKNSRKFRLFTFIRDPLDFRVSLYYYAKANYSYFENYKLSEVIINDQNLLSTLFPCDESNYKNVIDRYYFIGFVEEMQASLDKFADLINKKRQVIPKTNSTEKDSQLEYLPSAVLNKFKDQNKLDYQIYKYCRSKFDLIIFFNSGMLFLSYLSA